MDDAGSGTSIPVDVLLEQRARLEGKDLACGNGEGFAGLGITSSPVVLLLNDKLAEAGNFDFLAGSQGLLDDIKNGLHDLFRFFFQEITLLLNVVYQVFFCHGKISITNWQALQGRIIVVIIKG